MVFSLKVSHETAGFKNEERAGGNVPGLQTAFPEAVETAAGDISEVERGSAGAADTGRLLRDRSEDTGIALKVITAAEGEARADQGAAHFGVVDGVDVLFNTFAKSMAGIGAFVSGPRWLINLLRYNMRSQLYAKSLPMPMVIGALKRLELIRNHPEYQQKLWEIVRVLQSSLKENGFEIGVTNSPVTPVFLKGGIPEATNLVVDLRENHGIFCSMVVYPVIPKGEIILCIIPTAVHTLEDVNVTIEAFKAVRSKLQDGIYAKLPIPVRADEGFLVR